MSLIQVSRLTFSYEGSYDPVFENVSFELDTNWKLGFIGRNGQGKTTFLKLLMGCYEYKGSISSSVGFDYFPFEVPDPEEMVIEVAQRHSPDLELWIESIGRCALPPVLHPEQWGTDESPAGPAVFKGKSVPVAGRTHQSPGSESQRGNYTIFKRQKGVYPGIP